MGGTDDGGWRRPGSPPGGGDPPAGADVLESGNWRRSARRWRPPQAAVVLGAAGLLAGLAGLAAGYVIGTHHAGNHPAALSRSRGAARAASPPVAGDFPLSQAGPECSAQTGHELQLGLQVTNTSATAVTLRRVDVVLPLGGLRPVAQAWGPCGELPSLGQASGAVLPAGASTWFTVTLRVLVGCPQALPVQFRLRYDLGGRPGSSFLAGFSDLGQVPYAGCR
jgi:hypothetical protein